MGSISARNGRLCALLAVALVAGLPAPAAVAGPTSVKLVRLPFPKFDGTLTPYSFDVGYPLVTLIYDTLMWRDANGIAQPWLARSVQRSRGGRRVTVKLRSGARWHDGRPVTAADVEFTFRYMAEHFQARFTPQLAGIEQVRAGGKLTVTFDLRSPSLGFDDQPLADVPILPRHLWRDLPAGRAAPRGPAVGSGPYRLVSAGKVDGYVLRASRRYFRGAPRVQEIRVPIIDDTERTYQALRDRKVDMIPLSLPPEAAGDFASTLGIIVRNGTSYSGTALVLNVRRAPFDRPAVRRAVAASLNLGRIVRNIAPAESAVQGLIHPASRWAAGVPVQRFDAAAARRVLGRPGRAPIRVLAPEADPVRLEGGRQVVLALRRAGAKATLVKLSSRMLRRATSQSAAGPGFDAAIQSTPPLASYDPDYLRTLFGSTNESAPLNVSGYRSDAFDRLAGRVASAPDRHARLAATRQELRLLGRDAPSIPLFFSEGAFAIRPAIYDGWTFIKGSGILDKQSFLPGPAAPAESTAPDDGGAASADPAGDSGPTIGVVDVITIVILVGVVLFAAFALLQNRLPRRRRRR